MLITKRYKQLDLVELLPASAAEAKEPVEVLFVYAHPDDETMASGGLMLQLSKSNKFKARALTLTKGEAGDELLKLTKRKLARLREQEYADVMTVLGIEAYTMWDYPDGGVSRRYEQAKSQLRAHILHHRPAIVVTHEKFGIYGHPDHVAISQMVAELAEELVNSNGDGLFAPLYATIPEFIARRIDLPTFMADDPENVVQTTPEYHLNVVGQLLKKFKAARAYKSQNLMRGKRMLYWPLYAGFEYYTRKWVK